MFQPLMGGTALVDVYKRQIEDGAYFKGSIEIDKSGDAGEEKSASHRTVTRSTSSAAL